jgi:triacylglycerol lipase
VPFDNSIDMTTAPIADHATFLAFAIPAKAAECGARHVHVVAHSKGGLDVRASLALLANLNLPLNFGVLSLTTLSTPHHGSVGADYSFDAKDANSLFSDSLTRTKLAQQAPPDVATGDLRVSFVDRFNATNIPLLPRTLTIDGVNAADRLHVHFGGRERRS